MVCTVASGAQCGFSIVHTAYAQPYESVGLTLTFNVEALLLFADNKSYQYLSMSSDVSENSVLGRVLFYRSSARSAFHNEASTFDMAEHDSE
jgi:hypothetical protein